MKDSVRLGRVAGVQVGLHWSLLAMVALVAGGLADNRFSVEAPGYSGTAYAVAGALTAVGLLVGVLVHELGHAVVARRLGLEVDGITLSWMGGLTRIEGDTSTPAGELFVAGIGPLASAAVGGLLFAVRLAFSGHGLVWAGLSWLAGINIVLAVFNILPASPLDGGRVLHSAIWAATRDRWKATRWASGTGVAFGAAMVVGGLFVTAHYHDLLDGVLVGFVGWWLVGSARAELSVGAVHRALDGVRMAELMRPVGEAPGWVTVRHFAEQFAAGRPGWVWLLKGWDGGYSGVLLGDSLSAVPFMQWDLARPVDFAVPVSATTGAAPDDDALTTLARTGGRQIVFVVRDGRTVGAVLPSDVEGLVHVGGRVVAGRQPAPGRAH